MLPLVLPSVNDICIHTFFSGVFRFFGAGSATLDRFEQMVGIYRKRAGFDQEETWRSDPLQFGHALEYLTGAGHVFDCLDYAHGC